MLLRILNLHLLIVISSCSLNKTGITGNAKECFYKNLNLDIVESYSKKFGHKPISVHLIKSKYVKDCEGLFYFSSSIKTSANYYKVLFVDKAVYVNYLKDTLTQENINALQQYFNKYDINKSQQEKIWSDFSSGKDFSGIGR